MPEMMKFSNPRLQAVVPDWPHGQQRVTATFEVQTNKRGSRVLRTTTGKPKATNYFTRAAIVDGEDGRTHVVAQSDMGPMVLIPGTLKGMDYFYARTNPDMYEQIRDLLGMVTPEQF